MAARYSITAEYLHSILHYDPKTGVFTWHSRRRERFNTQRAYSTWNARYAGCVAGCSNNLGYRLIRINNLMYYSHRIAWIMMTGEWPDKQIDHINLDKGDNRFSNLREATYSENSRNTSRRSDNTSGRKGVSWDSRNKKWCAQINIHGRHRHLGLFDSDKLDEAAAAYERAAKELHGEFARTDCKK